MAVKAIDPPFHSKHKNKNDDKGLKRPKKYDLREENPNEIAVFSESNCCGWKSFARISVQITVNDIILLNISFQSLLFSRTNKYYLDRGVLVCRCKATRKKK